MIRGTSGSAIKKINMSNNECTSLEIWVETWSWNSEVSWFNEMKTRQTIKEREEVRDNTQHASKRLCGSVRERSEKEKEGVGIYMCERIMKEGTKDKTLGETC